MTTSPAQQLQPVRDALLDLHKTLVDGEKASYEQTVGIIKSPNHFLQLLTTDPWFAWIQPISLLIVAMDEAIEEKEPLTQATVEAFKQQTRTLLVATEEGDGFSKHFYDALQREPDVVLAQGKLAKLITPPGKPAQPG